MILFLVIAAVILIAVAIIWLLSTLWDYAENLYDSAPKIKFKSFIAFYEINPERWELYDGCVECRITDDKKPYSSLFAKRETFCFTFIDYIRYRIWYNAMERHETEQSKAKITAKMIASVKQDIAKVEQLAQSELDEAHNIIQSIKKEAVK